MSEKRNQFTFYRSYWEAMKGLGKRDRQAILEAVIGYALDGQMAGGLSSLQMAMFSLIKPTLDSGRRKAVNGRIGGSKPEANSKQTVSKPEANSKQTVSKPEAKRKQNQSEKEIEAEKEVEIELEIELEGEREKEKDKRSSGKAPAPELEGAFSSFWEAYPAKIGRQAAWKAWEDLKPDSAAVEKILEALTCWKASQRWQEDGGRFIPRAAKWLSEGHWMAPPAPCQEGTSRELDPEEQAAIRRMMEEESHAGTP